MRVWSPDANIPVRLKIENRFNDQIFAEAETQTTVASQWETLTFNFLTPPAGAPGLNLNEAYGKIIVFFNFGTDGATAGAKTYYWDDVQFLDSAIVTLKPDLPITFEDSVLGDYGLSDFGGAASQIITDPTDPNNKVAETLRTDQAVSFAGTTAGLNGLASAIPFTQTETYMSVRVWSADANIPVRLKVENSANGGISVETEDTTNVAGGWEYLVFNFENNVDGTPALDLNSTYDKVNIFFNFGAEGSVVGAQTYYWDNVSFGDSTGAGVDNILPFLNEGITVYPNPANTRLTVEFETLPAQAATVTIYDISGRLVRETSVRQLSNTIDVRTLQEGMYLLLLESREGIFRQKVTIRR